MRMPSEPLDARLRPSNSPPLPLPLSSDPNVKEKCPRCDSRDTKFCYYNNYNTSQPRHFCRSCRRYWTLGGSLRNVPIGGSSRKRLRPNPTPIDPTHYSIAFSNSTGNTPSFNCHVSLAQPAAVLPLRSFRFDLGLGLGEQNEPGPAIEELQLGSTALVWPPSFLGERVGGDTWRVGSGGEPVTAAGDVSGGGNQQ